MGNAHKERGGLYCLRVGCSPISDGAIAAMPDMTTACRNDHAKTFTHRRRRATFIAFAAQNAEGASSRPSAAFSDMTFSWPASMHQSRYTKITPVADEQRRNEQPSIEGARAVAARAAVFPINPRRE
ncbi:MAG: hypothetical protein R2762_01625 [Bryobacteraceae bacterium]